MKCDRSTPFGNYFKPMLALFAGESKELAMDNGLINLRAREAGDRMIMKPVRMLPLEMHLEIVEVLLTAILSGL